MPPDTQRCSVCGQVLPLSQFLWNGRRGDFRVTGCNSCVNRNMARWAKSNMVGKMPDEFEDKTD